MAQGSAHDHLQGKNDTAAAHGESAPTSGARDEVSQPSNDTTPSKQTKPIPLFTIARIASVRMFLMGWSHVFGMSGLYFLGQLFGTCEFLIDYNRRRRVMQKMAELFGNSFTPKQRFAHARRYFMRIRCDKMFYTIMDRIPRGKLMNRIKLIDRHYIDDGLAREKGVYVALCHFGSHYIAGLMMALLGYEVSGLRDPKESTVRRYIQQKYRETFPEVEKMAIFPANSFPREVYRRLKRNTLVASLIDPDRRRSETAKWTTVKMFGVDRELLAGPLQIAFRCGATTVHGFVVSRKNFYYQLIVMPPLVEPGQERDDEETIQLAAQRYAQSVEKFALAHPDHLMNI
ncbi:MAG: lysophospholipid acyltransferase family protein [Planctomycetes bacterium]|nr:lysophospholipid acyltransferase family protein [Planctomycetota bacterium]